MKPTVFLDRDGTINKEKNYLYKIEDFEYTEGAVTALKKLKEAGFLLIIISNQSGIARGYYTEEDYGKLNKWMLSDLKSKGVLIDGCYYCPHHPRGVVEKYRVDCNCRKPGTELFYRAIKEHDIDVSKSYAVGDKLRDLAVCKEIATQGILITDKNFSFLNIEEAYQKKIWISRNLAEAVEKIIHVKKAP